MKTQKHYYGSQCEKDVRHDDRTLFEAITVTIYFSPVLLLLLLW